MRPKVEPALMRTKNVVLVPHIASPSDEIGRKRATLLTYFLSPFIFSGAAADPIGKQRSSKRGKSKPVAPPSPEYLLPHKTILHEAEGEVN